VRQQAYRDLVKELLLGADLFWCMRRPPALVVDSAYDERKLLAEIDGFGEGQAVAQLVKDSAKYRVSFGLARQSAIVAQLFQPFLRLLHGMSYGRWQCHRHHSLGNVPGKILDRIRRLVNAPDQIGASAKRTNSGTGWARGWI